MFVPAMLSLALLQDQVGDGASDPSDLFSGVGSAFIIALLLAVTCVAIAIAWRNYRGLVKRSVRRRRHRRHKRHQRPTIDPALLAPTRKFEAAADVAGSPTAGLPQTLPPTPAAEPRVPASGA